MVLTEDVVVAHVWEIAMDTTETYLAQGWGFPWMSCLATLQSDPLGVMHVGMNEGNRSYPRNNHVM